MLINRMEFSLDLVNRTPLQTHGDEALRSGPEERLVRDFLKDGRGMPLIPASTVKGALADRHNGAFNHQSLFGDTQSGQTSVGTKGRLELDDLVYSGDVGPDTAARTRNAINRQRGAADDHKLFEQNEIAKGQKFCLSGRLFFDGDDHLPTCQEIMGLVQYFEPDTVPVSLGASGKFGLGQFERIPQNVPKLTVWKFDRQNGSWPKQGETVDPLPQAGGDDYVVSTSNSKVLKLELSCDMPFLVAADKPEDDVSISPLMDGDGPALPATSVYGALRSRAEWLEGLYQLRNGQAAVSADSIDEVINPKKDLRRLLPLQRIFGVTGFRGLLSCRKLDRVDGGTQIILQNVAIDRFTGGAMDGALYATKSYCGTRWNIEFGYDIARAERVYEAIFCDEEGVEPDQLLNEDNDVLGRLSNDLTDNGLMLGHGTSNGYGWFGVQVSQTQNGVATHG